MADHGYTTQLDYSTAGDGSYTEATQVINIQTPQSKVKEVDTTHLKSTNAVRTFMPGFRDEGAIKFKANYVKAQQTLLRNLHKGRTTSTWKLTLPDGSTWIGPAFISDMGTEVPEDDRLTCDLTLKCTGEWTWTAAA